MKSKAILLMVIALVASGCAADSDADTSQNDNLSTPEDTQSPEDSSDTSKSDNTTDSEDSSQPGDTSNSPVTVTYTDSGFQPQTVTIEAGETVRWESEASGSMWIGSDQHPIHTEYDGSSTSEHCENQEPVSTSVFDQCSSGQTFSFTFEKTGEWGYHNHKYSRHQGTVIVE